MIKISKTNPFVLYICAAIFCAFIPVRALAQMNNSFDGGELKGVDTMCTCSGGETIKVNSYVDNSQHVYLYELGASTLFANYNIMSSNGYFLATLTPMAQCLVYEGEECNQEGQRPEGTFSLVGTSFNEDKNGVLSFLKVFPMVSDVTSAFSKSISLSSLKISDPRI